MKKIWLFILGLFTIFLIWNITQARDYEYTNLDITASILDDWTMSIKENYTANFFVNKHWIIRYIPLNYIVEWQQFHINVLNVYVDWKKFTTSNNNWNVEIKIWDANKTVIWEQNYPISYSTYGLIKNFSWMGYAELYWNLVGYDFDTNIKNVKAEIFLPKTYTWFTANDFLITADWYTKTVKEFWWTVDRKWWNKITITYDKWLPAYQWITLAVKFPNNYFNFDDEKQAKLLGKYKNNLWDSISNIVSNSLYSLLELFWIIGLIIIAFKKFKNKSWKIDTKSWTLSWDFAKQFPVIVQYTPPQWLNSAEVWLLLHREAQAKDILSLIYKRAADWLINISTEKTEWFMFSGPKDILVITKNRDIPEEAPDFEKSFFKSLVRSEKNKIDRSSNLYNRLGLFDLEHYGKRKWRLTSNNKKSIIILLWFIWSYFLINFLPMLWIILLFWLIIFSNYTKWEPKLKETEEWAKLISHILWYREFLAACDENKLRLFLQKDPLYFDKILPYAVVFWLDTELLKKITPIMQEMQIHSKRWDINSIYLINDTISSVASHSLPPKASYSSSGWFSSWSSFGWGFSSGWGWGWWGWRSR